MNRYNIFFTVFVFISILSGISIAQENRNCLLIDSSLCPPQMPMDFKDSIKINDTLKGFTIDEKSYNVYGFNEIEKYNKDFRYEILMIEQYQNLYYILILRRFYPSEIIHWFLTLSKECKLIDFLEIAYQNAEGFYSVKSRIINHSEIKVRTWNDYKAKEVINSFFISKDGTFINHK